jgi:hypothetical protein
LLPDGSSSQENLNHAIAYGAQVVLDHLHPYPDPDNMGFRNELRLEEFDEVAPRRLARRALTAGSSMGLVERAKYDQPMDGRYVLHNDFVKTLTRLRAKMLLSASPAAAQIGATLDGGDLRASRAELGHSAAKAMLPPANSNQAKSPAAAPFAHRPVQAERPTTLEPVTGGGDLAQRLVEHFAEQMALQPATIEYLVKNHGRVDVQGLWRQLDLVLRRDEQGLRRPLQTALKSIAQNIEEARETFPSQAMTAPGAATAFNDFADKLKDMQVAMVMLPGAAYDNRINMMEKELTEDAAAGRLDAAKQAKLGLLVDHRSDLARAMYTQDHWSAVIRALMKFEHGLAALAGADQRPQRMA